MEFEERIPNLGYIQQLFQKHISEKEIRKIRSLKLLQNFKGVVFDVHVYSKANFLALQEKIEDLVVYEAETLPQYFENDNDEFGQFFGKPSSNGFSRSFKKGPSSYKNSRPQRQ